MLVVLICVYKVKNIQFLQAKLQDVSIKWHKFCIDIFNQIQVRLIGYCTEGSLFLVYEYIENGNLSEHLRRSGKITAC